MKSGAKPTKLDHRDYDYHRSFGTVAAQFPPEYRTDAGLWVPDQNSPEPMFKNPAMPYGCTDYTQADLCADEDGVLKNPALIEALTLANQRGGGDIREALKAAATVFHWGMFFNITPQSFDAFDSIRLAILSGVPEKRSVSIGTPWYPEFEQTNSSGLLNTPRNFSTSNATWHNWKICGWVQINGEPFLIGKSWQGAGFGDKGFHYLNRALTNSLMAVRGSAAFTITRAIPSQINTVQLSPTQTVLSYLRTLVGYFY